jgi:FkbM family methyltransferase
MLNWLRGAIPGAIKLPLKRFLGVSPTRLNDDWAILRHIGPIERSHVVLDVGAHHGWFFHCWQDWCPGAQVHAFEPYPESFQSMRNLYGSDPRVTLNQIAIGDVADRLPLRVMSDSKVSNSLLRHRPEAWEEIRYRTGVITETDVEVTTLDIYCRKRSIDTVYLLKVDVQGYELRALRGAREMLRKVDHIFVESGIRPLYEDSARFTEVVEFLQDEGFHLMALRTWHRGNHVLIETDMLFRRNELAPNVDESVVRVVEE